MGTPAFPEDNGKNKRTAGVVKLIDAVASAGRSRACGIRRSNSLMAARDEPRIRLPSVRRKPPSVRHTYSLVEIGQKKGMDGKQILA
jgi:hypothetical protein